MEFDNFFSETLVIPSGSFEHLLGNLLIIFLRVLESSITLSFTLKKGVIVVCRHQLK